MIEDLIQKLEEKVITLVSELDDARKELARVRKENASLKAEKEDQRQKLSGLISLLDAVDIVAEQIVGDSVEALV
jgi:regulator of replication initiation timing